jgi:hypothetical protein
MKFIIIDESSTNSTPPGITYKPHHGSAQGFSTPSWITYMFSPPRKKGKFPKHIFSF